MKLQKSNPNTLHKKNVVYNGKEGLLARNERFLENKKKKLEEVKKHRESMDEANNYSFKPIINKNAAKNRSINDLLNWNEKVKLNKSVNQFSDEKDKKTKHKAFKGPVYTNNRFLQLDKNNSDKPINLMTESVNDRLYHYKDIYESNKLVKEKMTYNSKLYSEIQTINTNRDKEQDTSHKFKTEKNIGNLECDFFSHRDNPQQVKAKTMEDLKRTKVKRFGLSDTKIQTKDEIKELSENRINDKVAKVISLDRSMTKNSGEIHSINRSGISIKLNKSRTPNKNNQEHITEGVEAYIRKIEKEMKE